MQKSIGLLAFLPYLHWFGSLVDGATELTSPASPIRMLQPQNLNSCNGLPGGLIVINKERGAELPAVDLFETGIVIIDAYLAPEDWNGFIPLQAWTLHGIVLGVSLNERQGNVVQRSFVISGIYFIFSLMKSENDFRSGVFEIQYCGDSVYDIVIFTTGSSGLNTLLSFAHVTQLAPPPSPIAHNTNSSSQLVASALGSTDGLSITIYSIEPFQPLDELDLLISLLDTLVTIAEPPEDERVQNHTNTVFGVKTSISPVIDARPPGVMTYDQLLWVVSTTTDSIIHVKEFGPWWIRGAQRMEVFIFSDYVGEITIVPVNSSAPTSSRNPGTGTATARKKRFIA